MKVIFTWQDEDCAGVLEILCDCGYRDTTDRIVSDGEKWTCPKCRKTLVFKWVGMIWEVI